MNASPTFRATLDKRPDEVAAMFDRVAPRYDLVNTVTSLGQDRRWRRLTREALRLTPGDRVLDVGAGTGVSTVELSRSGAYVVGVDFSTGMLGQGRDRGVPLVAGDGLHLPFADAAFDAVTISYTIRNFVDVDAGLRELARVTKPGGRLVIAELSHPTWAPFRTVYVEYLMRAMPLIARVVSSNPDAYDYLAESIRAWDRQPELARRMEANGWGNVAWRNLTFGIAALHRATRPASPGS